MAEIARNGQVDDAFIRDDVWPAFAGLERYRSLLLAVSGGADSVALLLLIARWVQTQSNPPQIEVATIDHDLRQGSADDATWVADLSAKCGFAHHVRRWSGEKPTTGVQAAARAARYQLLLDIVRVRHLATPTAIVTAHTQDDQAETVVMRLSRGSGPDGIGAMALSRPLKVPDADVDLVRPLLDIPKSQLMAFLDRMSQTWLEDPSNRSQDFERVRVRQAQPALEALGLSSAALSVSASRARRASRALDDISEKFLRSSVAVNNGACAVVDLAKLFAAPDEIQIRVLKQILAGFGGAAPPARLQQLETLQHQLNTSSGARSVTLGGCVVEQKKGQLTVYRELGRQPLPTLMLYPGDPVIWDQRFLLARADPDGPPGACPPDIEVRALDPAVVAALRPHVSSELQGIPAAAAQTLPSFWCEGRLLAVPPLNIDQEFLAARDGNEGFEAGIWSAPAGHNPCTVNCQAQFVGLEDVHFDT